MPYATLDELKRFVGIDLADTTDNETLTLALDAASGQVDAFCDRKFSADANPVARQYVAVDSYRLSVEPIASTTGLVVATDDNGDGTFETTWVLGTDYRLEPLNASADGQPWTTIVGLGTRTFPRHTHWPGVQVTARYGWPTGSAPAGVKHATLVQSSRLWKRKDAPFGVAGSVEFGSEIRLLAKLDPDVESLLRPYRRTWWAV
jgi:hypothetical protein